MPYPSMSDYREAIQAPKIAFKSYEFQQGIVKQNQLGLPLLVSGGFALTACLTNSNNGKPIKWAVRFFHKEVPDLQERYGYISKFLQGQIDNFFVGFIYEPEGIKVQGNWYPIVKMDWVEGKALSEYIDNEITNPSCINNLSNQLKLISKRLRELKMAHGDLQHGNILVRNDGSLVLIDYDGMYVPSMTYKYSNELGHVAFQHPDRTSSFFNEKIDRFSIIVLYVSLLALASPLGKSLWNKYHTGENLIFSRKDYLVPDSSAIFTEFKNVPHLSTLVNRLQQVCRCSIDDVPVLEDFLNPSVNLSNYQTVVTFAPSSLALTNGTSVFSAQKTLDLVKQEGEKITVVGEVVSTYLLNDSIMFVNFGDFRSYKTTNLGVYSCFTIVIFPQGLDKLIKVKGLSSEKIRKLKNRYVKVTGILEIYPKKGYKSPQIILEDPYQLQIIQPDEVNNLLSSSNISLPSKPIPRRSPSPASSIPQPSVPQPALNNLPPKPVPPKSVTPQPALNNLPPKPVPPQPVPPTSLSKSYSSPQPSAVSQSSSASTSQTQSNSNSSSSKTTNNTSNNDCFIATAVYESATHPDLETFRAFRDQVLLTNLIGRILVKVYYQIGPYLAVKVSSYIPAKQFVRYRLEWIARWIRTNMWI